MLIDNSQPYPFQTLRSVPSAIDVVIPEPAKSFYAALDLTALNPLELIAGECVNEGLGSYDTRVVVSFIGFVIVCLANW